MKKYQVFCNIKHRLRSDWQMNIVMVDIEEVHFATKKALENYPSHFYSLQSVQMFITTKIVRFDKHKPLKNSSRTA